MSSCKKLCTLSFYNTHCFVDRALCIICTISSHPERQSLDSLSLTGCFQITSLGYEAVALSGLRALKIALPFCGFDGDFVNGVAAAASAVQSLAITYCAYEPDEGDDTTAFLDVTTVLGVAAESKNLTELTLRMNPDCECLRPAFSSGLLEVLGTSAFSLTSLTLEGYVCDDDIEASAISTALLHHPDLTSLRSALPPLSPSPSPFHPAPCRLLAECTHLSTLTRTNVMCE
jgi:hypothetical protein